MYHVQLFCATRLDTIQNTKSPAVLCLNLAASPYKLYTPILYKRNSGDY